MKPIFTIRMLQKILFFSLAMGLTFGIAYMAYADTPLNESNLINNSGRPYWLIDRPGSYYLDFKGETFYTTNYFAIRIRCSNVTLDGRGKTVTGAGPPADDKGTDDICGVLVNSGPRTESVYIRNLNVEKKYHGILFEWIYKGNVQNCNTNGNQHGITLWNSELTTLSGNTANYNKYGIVLDANLCVNKNNTIINNTANKNDLVGIILHLENINNELNGNFANENGHFGISLPDGSDSNVLSGNTTDSNNSCGIHIQYSSNNTIEGNTMRNNRERGIWLLSATNNIIYNNYFNNPDKNVSFDGSNSGNRWNVDRAEGPNILGGPYLGGNFWANPGGTGFSQVTADSNKDGICDSGYTISSGNVDQYPLHAYEVVVTVTTVITSIVSSVNCNSASSGGDVAASGGASVTARGVCWSTSENPTVNDSHTADGMGIGTFQSSITSLEPGTDYYLRAYAANSAGTAYGDVLPFTTDPFEGIIYVSPIDQTCGGNCPCFDGIRTAIEAPYAAHTLKIAQGTYGEAFSLNDARDITLEGGWNDSFTEQVPNETIIKAPTVNAGSITFRNLIIGP